MTPRERMLTAMKNGVPDHVPAAPDMSNMIPCRLTGKPFWDIYLFQDPPLWMAYINAVKHFGFDGWLPGVPVEYECCQPQEGAPQWKEAIVLRAPDRIYTRRHAKIDGKQQWSNDCTVYYIDNPPTRNVSLSSVGLPEGPPETWEDVQPRNSYPGRQAFIKAKELMGEHGVVGIGFGLPGLSIQPESIYEYFDNPDQVRKRCEREHEHLLRVTEEIIQIAPDFLLIGISGFMISNPEPIFRELALPALKDITTMCKKAGLLTQIHCCGPEFDLVRIAAEETDLDSINPLEAPPMGDCNLAEVKRLFGSKLSLMGNLHTTDIMLHGTVNDVIRASQEAIDAAAEGGGFILSTGDQCGRDTPDENIYAMIETAATYGKYRV